MKVKCQQCGREIWVRPSALKEGRGKYCSRKCLGLANRSRVTRKCKWCEKEFWTYLSMAKKGCGKYCSNKCFEKWRRSRRVERTCVICKKVFEIHLCMIRKGGGICCSRSCAAILRRGKGNGRWIDGRSFFPYGPEFNRFLKKKIREKYENICQKCKNKFTRSFLEVHHLDHDKFNNTLKNLILWCKSCHARYHINYFRERKREICLQLSYS